MTASDNLRAAENAAPIHLFDEVDSTNDLALSAADRQALHGTCWAADHQTKGRGRREVGGGRRAWFSPRRANLYMSVLLRPALDANRASGLTLATAAGVCGLLREECEVDLWVKWPNDLWVGNKKLGGILSEAVSGPGGLEAVVVGLGINVNLTAEQVPEELRQIMTSLQIETGREFDRMWLLQAIRRRVIEYSARYERGGYASILEELRAFDRTRGRVVSVLREGAWVEAISRGISDDGGLRVEVAGELQNMLAGEVRFVG